MTRLRSSTFALRATADKSSSGEARSAWSQARRGIRTAVTTAAAVMIGGGSSVLACPMCFGAEETSIIDGAKLGVLVMLGQLLRLDGESWWRKSLLVPYGEAVADVLRAVVGEELEERRRGLTASSSKPL